MIPHWMTVSPTFWDTLYLDGELVPGLPQITIVPKRNITTTKSKDLNGVSQADNGYEGAAITGRLRITTLEELDLFYSLYPRWSPSRAASDPIAIWYPSTLLARIDAITIKQWMLPPPTGTEWIVQFTADQWFPEEKKQATSAPKTNTGNPSPGGGSGGGLDPSAFDVPDPDPANLGPTFP